MKAIFLILVFILIAGHGWTQETNHNQFSSAPENARYQIVQSELVAKITFKIDKYTGKVFQLVEGENGITWQVMNVESHSQEKTIPEKVNYQIFTSGLTIRLTFLLNVNTGATWELAEDSDNDVFWKAMD